MIELLDEIILGMRQDLEYYVKKDNVNSFIVDKNNERLKQLFEVRTYIDKQQNSINFHTIMSILEEMEKLKQKDPSLNGYNIYLIKNEGPRLGYIYKSYK